MGLTAVVDEMEGIGVDLPPELSWGLGWGAVLVVLTEEHPALRGPGLVGRKTPDL